MTPRFGLLEKPTLRIECCFASSLDCCCFISFACALVVWRVALVLRVRKCKSSLRLPSAYAYVRTCTEAWNAL